MKSARRWCVGGRGAHRGVQRIRIAYDGQRRCGSDPACDGAGHREDPQCRRHAGQSLPVRASVPDSTVAELISKVQIELVGALRHQRLSLRRHCAGRWPGFGAPASAFGPVVNMMFFDKPIEIDGATSEYQILSSGCLRTLAQPVPGAARCILVIDLHGHPDLFTH